MEPSLTKEIKKLLRYSGASLKKISETADGQILDTIFNGKKVRIFICKAV